MDRTINSPSVVVTDWMNLAFVLKPNTFENCVSNLVSLYHFCQQLVPGTRYLGTHKHEALSCIVSQIDCIYLAGLFEIQFLLQRSFFLSRKKKERRKKMGFTLCEFSVWMHECVCKTLDDGTVSTSCSFFFLHIYSTEPDRWKKQSRERLSFLLWHQITASCIHSSRVCNRQEPNFFSTLSNYYHYCYHIIFFLYQSKGKQQHNVVWISFVLLQGRQGKSTSFGAGVYLRLNYKQQTSQGTFG